MFIKFCTGARGTRRSRQHAQECHRITFPETPEKEGLFNTHWFTCAINVDRKLQRHISQVINIHYINCRPRSEVNVLQYLLTVSNKKCHATGCSLYGWPPPFTNITYLYEQLLFSLAATSGKHVTVWRRSVCLSVSSAYLPWLISGQHATRPAYISARQCGGPTYLLL